MLITILTCAVIALSFLNIMLAVGYAEAKDVQRLLQRRELLANYGPAFDYKVTPQRENERIGS